MTRNPLTSIVGEVPRAAEDQSHPRRGERLVTAARPSPRVLAAMVAVGIAATLALYQPWRRIPFDIVDFSEFLPLLMRPSIGRRWDGFTQYYTSQGRWNVLGYAALIAKWSLFGMTAPAWQALRFAEMWLIIGTVYIVLRRFGASMWGAAAGAGLFMISGPAVTAWLRLTMGEPLGLCILLVAVYLAQDYRTTTHWQRNAALIALCVGLALLVKEMLVFFVPFIIVIASCFDGHGRLELPLGNRRNALLLVAVGAAIVAVLVPVALVAHNAPHGSFVSGYGGQPTQLRQITAHLRTVVLPENVFSVWGGSEASIRAPANALFISVLLLGGYVIWGLGPRRGVSRSQASSWIVLSVSLSVIVVLAYSPWPYFLSFYGLPYLLGPAMLLAGAVTVIERLAPQFAFAARGLCVGIVLVTGLRDVSPAHRYLARRLAHGQAASYLATAAAGRAVVVMTNDIQIAPGTRWQGIGPTLGRYTAAIYPGAGITSVRDTACAVPPHSYPVGGRPAVVVSYAADCGSYPGASRMIRVRYGVPNLSPPGIRQDSMRIDICDSDCAR